MTRPAIIVLLVLASIATAPAQQTSRKAALQTARAKIMKEGRKNNQAMKHLDELVNGIGPRLTSSDNLTEACEWAVEKFKSFGIDNAHMVEWGTFPVGFNRGTLKGMMTRPEKIEFELTTRCWMPGTQGPTRGHAVMAPKNEAELEALGSKLKGAWVLSSSSGFRRRRGRRPEGGDNATNFRTRLAEAYKKAGILGKVQPGRSEKLVHTSGNYRISWDKLPSEVQVIIRRDQWKKVEAHLKNNKKVELEFDIQNSFKKGPIKLYNVIADVKGTEFPNQYVIFGGHIDSWDGATGTTDNGTGVATTLEAARLFMKSGIKPRRTIRFMLWSGEEQGLMGSWAWIRQNPDELDKISGVFVHDGGTNYVSGVAATKNMLPVFAEAMGPIEKLNKKLAFEIKEASSLPAGIGSDHDAFLSSGVPGFFWRQSGKANYNHTHHTQYDTYDSAVGEYEAHTSMVVALAAVGLGDIDGMIPRKGMRGRKLGVSMDYANMTVTAVTSGSAAKEAGLQKGDKLLKVGDRKITRRRDLRRGLSAIEGDEGTILVERDGKELKLTIRW